METKTVKYKLLDPRAKAPAYATAGAAAADLCALLDEPLTLAPGQRAMIPTGLAIELPDAQCVALLYARSGLAIKHGLTLPNCVGVIDSDYRGEVRVGLINLGTALHRPARGAHCPAVHRPGVAGCLCAGQRPVRHRPRRRRLWLHRQAVSLRLAKFSISVRFPVLSTPGAGIILT